MHEAHDDGIGESGAALAEQLAPASLVQRRMWFVHEMLEEKAAYNVGVALHLSGALDVPQLERALTRLVERHEILRTRLEIENGEIVQVISPPAPISLPVVDLTGSAEVVSAAERRAVERVREPFELDRAPLWRVELQRLSAERHVLLLSVHHVASDAWSLGILVRDLADYYGGACIGRDAALPELELQYADYAAWQAEWADTDACRKGIRFWRDALAGAPAVLDLPSDRSRPAVASYRGGSVTHRLPAALFERACELGREARATPFMVFLACFQALLYRLSGEEDVVVGVTSGTRGDASLEGLVGCFLNALAMRTRIAPGASFRRLLADVREVAWTAYEHRDVPFELVVEELQPRRSRSHAPLFQSMIVYENVPLAGLGADGRSLEEDFGTPDVRLRVAPVHTRTTKYDLTLYAWPSRDGLFLECEYATDLFDEPTIAAWLRRFERLVQGACAAPDAPLEELALCTPDEARARGPELPRAAVGGVHELFERSVARDPEAVAVRGRGFSALTRAELNLRANRLARALRARGVQLEDRVGICLERSPELVVAVLAVWKAGAAYVPLDPAYPTERLAYLVQDSAMKLVVTRADLVDRVPLEGVPVLAVDRDRREWARLDATDLHLRVAPDDVAYVLYTSGSTGLPKGVLGLHRTLINRIGWEPCPVGEGEACALRTSLNFIDSIWEIVGSLSHGMACVVIGEEISRDPWRLTDELEELGVSRMFLVPTLLKSMLAAELDWSRLRGVEYWLCGGEPLQSEIAERFRQVAPHSVLLNLYGTTEFWDAAWQDAARSQPGANIPIGRPIANVETWILDPSLHVVPEGVVGELYVSGEGLARGYHGQPGRTAERFLPHPYPARPGQRIYRTGDRARMRSDGSIEVLGRVDSQAKVRGHRVELAEVEHVLLGAAGVSEAVVCLRAPGGDPQLVAWVVPAGSASLDPAVLREHTRRFLPEYAVPAAVLVLDQLPMTPSGKIDRARLPEPDARTGPVRAAIVPASETERRFARLWEEILGAAVCSVDDEFFELGGDSVQMVRIVAAVRAMGYPIELRELYANPTLRGLAQLAEAALGRERDATREGPLERWWLDGPGRSLRLRADVRLIELTPGFDVEKLAPALRRLCEALPALQLRRGDGGREQQRLEADVRLDRITVDESAEALARLAAWSGGAAETQRSMAARALWIDSPDAGHLALCVPAWSRCEAGWSGVLSALLDALSAGARAPRTPTPDEQVLDLRAPCTQTRVTRLAIGPLERCAAALRLSVPELWLIAMARALDCAYPDEELWVRAVPTRGGVGAAAVDGSLSCASVGHLPAELGACVRAAKAQLRGRQATPAAPGRGVGLWVHFGETLCGEPDPGFARCVLTTHAPSPASERETPEMFVTRVGGAILAFEDRVGWGSEARCDGFSTAWQRALDDLCAVAEARSDDAQLLAPSDFPSAAIAPDALDELLRRCTARGDSLAALEDVYPLSSTQLGMVYHRLFDPESPAYFQQLYFQLEGEPDLDSLQRASARIVAEYDVFRLSVEWDGLEEPHQLLWRTVDASWHHVDVSGLEAAAQEREIEALLAESRSRGFDLGRPPLHRWLCIQRAPGRYTLVFSFHHLILDGWSTVLVLSRFFDLYEAFAAGQTVALARTPAYREFIDWHRRQDLDAAREFFRQRLRGVAAATPVGRNREGTGRAPADVGEDWGEVEHALSAPQTEALRELGRDLRLTLSTQVYAAWALVLARHAATKVALFGITVSGRSPELTAIDARVGLFINTVPLRVTVDDASSIDDWLVEVQRSLAEQSAYEATPLPVVQACSDVPVGRALFDSIVVFENFPMDARFRASGTAFGGQVTGAHFFERTSYPATLAAVPRPGEPLRLRLIYDRTLIDAELARDLLDDVSRVLRAFPDAPRATLASLHTRSRRRTPAAAAPTSAAIRTTPLVGSLWESLALHAARTPERVAIEAEGIRLSYREVDRWVEGIAHGLRRRGVGRETLVAVRIARSPLAIATLLAVVKAGAAYLPLDPCDPWPRAVQVIEELGAEWLLTTPALDDEAAEAEGAAACDVARWILDESPGAFAGAPISEGSVEPAPHDLAYVICTSGSSGSPKGVGIERRSLEFYARAAANEYELTPADRVLQFASLAFDASVEEIFPSLWAGATLVLRPQGAVESPSAFLDAIREQRISVLDLPTAYWHELCDALAEGAEAPDAPLRLVVIGGEPARARRWAQWRESVSDRIRVVNTYGPTEATVVASWCDLNGREAREPLPIGRPVPGVEASVRDADGLPVSAGAPGELCIAGPGVARGYRGQPGLTALRFVPDPELPGRPMYRTGDRVRMREDGLLEYLSRMDDQVKIRGFRVEPREVERTLTRHPAVRDCAVISVGAGIRQRLVAFVVADADADMGRLRAHVGARMPAAFVPETIHRIDALPMTSRGKVDRAALTHEAQSLEPTLEASDIVGSPGEELMAALWARALGVERVGLYDSFFDLGGNSLSGARLMFAVEHAFGVRLPLKWLFEAGTVAALTELVCNPEKKPASLSDELDLEREVELPADVVPTAPSRIAGREPSAVRSVLLTGATGLVGSFLLSELLETTDVRVFTLVRGSSREEILARLERNLARYRLPTRALARVEPVAGDLTAPFLGLGSEGLRELADRIDTIYHVAALIHRAAYHALAPTNVHGTTEILRLACTGEPKTLHHVSSMGIAAATSELAHSQLVSEATRLDDWRALPPGYPQTKWVAERRVNEAARRGLRVAIYRPGLVGGSAASGAASLEHTPSRVVRSLIELGVLPRSGDEYLRIIAVDQLARAIVYLSGQEDSIGRVHHLFDPERTRLADLGSWLRSAGYPLREVSRSEWIEQAVAQGQRSALFRALADALVEAEIVKDEIVWENSATLRALEPAEIGWGGMTEKSLHATLRYWVEQGAIPPPPPPKDRAVLA